MSYLIFDTETSGFPSKGLPREHPAQARICQLAFVYLDENFKCLESYSTLIKPDGWKISSGAQAAHGISLEDCHREGVPIKEAISIIDHMLRFNASKVVAHNIGFDRQLIDIESDLIYNWFSEKHICTMELMTPICKLPSKRMTYKWPKLQEAYKYCFGEEFKDAHDALADCVATAKVFKWLVEHRHVTV